MIRLEPCPTHPLTCDPERVKRIIEKRLRQKGKQVRTLILILGLGTWFVGIGSQRPLPVDAAVVEIAAVVL